jgi:predicted DNA-binding transcriptional regulator AlpA
MTAVAQQTERRLLTQIDVCRRLEISDETWRRWRAAGRTPEPAPLPGRKRWYAADIDLMEVPRSRTFGARRRPRLVASRHHGGSVRQTHGEGQSGNVDDRSGQ